MSRYGILFITLLIVLPLLAVAMYLVYVKGIFISPQIQDPVEIPALGKTFRWEVKKDMPTARSEVTATVLNGKIYVIGGFDGYGKTSQVVEVYDPKSDTWQKMADLPEGRHHAASVTMKNTIYVIGGFTGNFNPKSEVYEYNMQNSRWNKKNPMLTARGGLAATVIADKIYAMGGVGADGLSNRLEVYDPVNDVWEQKKDAPVKRDHLAAASLNGLLYVGAGREQSLSKNLAVLEVYDPQNDTWTTGTAMPTRRGGVAGTVLNNMFVVVGGEYPTGTFANVEAYNPKSSTWTRLPGLPTARHGLAAAVVDDKLYVIGGGKNPGLSVSGANEVLLSN